MTPIRFNQATWLAHRAIQAEQMGPAPLPHAVALPGAKVPISHDRLLAYQEAGHDQHSIVARVNENWARENAERLEAHRRWVAGPYVGAIEEMRRRRAEEAARQMRERATYEHIVAEWNQREGE